MGCKSSRTAEAIESCDERLHNELVTDQDHDVKAEMDDEQEKEEGSNAEAGIETLDETKCREGDFEVTIERKTGGESMGISVVLHQTNYLRIGSVNESGLIPDWNATNIDRPEVQLRPGDVITRVNGVSGSFYDMVNELRQMRTTLSAIRGVSPQEATSAVKQAIESRKKLEAKQNKVFTRNGTTESLESSTATCTSRGSSEWFPENVQNTELVGVNAAEKRFCTWSCYSQKVTCSNIDVQSCSKPSPGCKVFHF
eukprot:TRINITY_DN30131_c0_g1_i1.p1 TRINITY_DN30131_c0_g1~~TRINITY_DN30131_c0_g1_i1.p1  ORF type:complete len:255 (+),score=47.25 TRINITY_DN30131_c0_g1_i1:39-803(+)